MFFFFIVRPNSVCLVLGRYDDVRRLEETTENAIREYGPDCVPWRYFVIRGRREFPDRRLITNKHGRADNERGGVFANVQKCRIPSTGLDATGCRAVRKNDAPVFGERNAIPLRFSFANKR